MKSVSQSERCATHLRGPSLLTHCYSSFPPIRTVQLVHVEEQ